MVPALIETFIIACLATYLASWRISIHRRKALAWKRLTAQLQMREFGAPVSGQFSRDESEDHKLDESRRSIQGAKDLWTMYRNARIMMDMADYAAQNGAMVSPELLLALRSDAVQIRIYVLAELSKYACNRANESASLGTAQVAAIYEDMVNRTAEMLQTSAGELRASPALVLN